jgi:hypothetical protein
MTRIAEMLHREESPFSTLGPSTDGFLRQGWSEQTACVLPSPKQNGSGSSGRASWYRYYAGYSAVFVRSVLDQCGLGGNAVVLDPWNGAGTTTQVANDLGYGCIGFDLNPAMVLVAKARLLDQRHIPDLRHVLTKVLQTARSYRTRRYQLNDPLELWLTAETVLAVRHIERAIRQTFVADPLEPSYLGHVDAGMSFAFLALFRTIRQSLASFKASNPMWLKTAKSVHELVSITAKDLAAQFERHWLSLIETFEREENHAIGLNGKALGKATIEVADSVQVPLVSQAADIVISSPPYCTRIDYAVATNVELAVLGFDPSGSLKELRNRMIGTSTIKTDVPQAEDRWGVTCNELLSKIATHHSKCSLSYYFKTHVQYFDGMYRSLCEIGRCLRPKGHCVLVLQDSYYKELHNNLPQIVAEMAASLGWNLHCRSDFHVPRTMAGMNRKSRQYRRSHEANESVLWFRIPGARG